MFKKAVLITLCIMLVIATLAGCTEKASTPKSDMRVGMVTDAGTIDDKSFNQGTWEGILAAAKDFGITTRYLMPAGTTEADYLIEIGNLYDADFRFIVTPGFKFETAIFQAQSRYEDAKFVLIDGIPHNGRWDDGRIELVGENTVSIFFAEHESGFLAGVATAIELQNGEVGFIGGMEIPPVQRFNWGFQQGIKYANENHGTNIVMRAQNIIYQGSFDNVAAGQQLAAAMFDMGIDAIFVAAGGVGVGAINEAKARAKVGRPAWIVGVDVDQFADGIYEDDKSIILTSAMKRIDQAAYDMIKAEINGEFPGGQTLVFNAKNYGVGIPENNPNLSKETQKIVNDIFKKLQSGDIVVSDVQGDLIR